MNIRLILKAIAFTLLLPGTVAFLIPYRILSQPGTGSWPGISGTAVCATISGLVGATVLVLCIWGFALHGKGTLAPIDPPKVLVVHGLYRHTRNPMYLSVMLVLLSEALLFESVSLLVYSAGVFLFFHVFVFFHEEPHLRSTYGKSYEEYFNAVPRWGFTRRAFESQETG